MEIPINPIPSENKPQDPRLKKIKYSLPKLPTGPCCVLGRVGAGKSSCVYSMLEKGYVVKGKSVFDEIVVYNGNQESDWAFEKLPCKNIAILHEFDIEAFENYIEDLRKHQLERLAKGKHPLNICLVFDDMATADLLKRRNGKSPLGSLCLTSRHELNASIFFLSQVFKSTGFQTPMIRNNVLCWIIYNMSKPEAEKIFDDHCQDFEPKDLIQKYEKCMEKPHNFLVIDYRRPMNARITEGFTKVIRPTGKPPVQLQFDHPETSSDEEK
jgi:hypothetical protein